MLLRITNSINLKTHMLTHSQNGIHFECHLCEFLAETKSHLELLTKRITQICDRLAVKFTVTIKAKPKVI